MTGARRVVVPRNVDGLVYGTAGEFGTWFFENYADLGVALIEGKGGRIFRACEHDGTHALHDLPDETVPLVEHVELLAKVEELHQRVDPSRRALAHGGVDARHDAPHPQLRHRSTG